MEANFFRAFVREAASLLRGQRIQNIYSPAPGLWTFKFSSRQSLLFSPSPKGGALFFTSAVPDNPATPPARVMWFRKRINGARIDDIRTDWPKRSVALQLRSRDPGWLLFSVRKDPELVGELPEGFGLEPKWPALERVLQDKEVWRDHPQITPPLRRTLEALDNDAAHRLYRRVVRGETGRFYVYTRGREVPVHVLSWPFPAQLKQDLQESSHNTALDAAASFGRLTTRPLLAQTSREDAERRRLLKKVKRSLQKLEDEEQRMRELVGLGTWGEVLKANLYRTDQGSKVSEIRADFHGEPRTIDLDPGLTVLENMERFFKLSRKGRRGLEHAARRRQTLEEELRRLESGDSVVASPAAGPGSLKGPSGQVPARWRNLAVHRYRSSDGFTIVRGKNQSANHKLLTQAARPFDLWFHARGGPGSHVILKRDHDGQDVPDASLREAAVLAGLASHQAGSMRAEVVSALVKDVRTVKGAGLGRVRVDQEWRSFSVRLDQEVETRLRVS
ncbi:MAG: NFACT RNA binding domain-containing protein [Desulfohalobiaceae bacterium]